MELSLKKKFPHSYRFHQKTKIKKEDIEILTPKTGALFFPIEYKNYPRFPKIKLPSKVQITHKYFEDVILSRRSQREFKGKYISLRELSYILFLSCGISRIEDEQPRRTYPSAGALYPIEVYPIILRVKNTPPGIYHYNVREHVLEKIKEEKLTSLQKKVKLICCNQEFVEKAAVCFILTAIFTRTLRKYGERGYRYILLEGGHIGQNFYLTSTSLNLKCYAIGGFLDDEIRKLLDIEKIENEEPIYVIVIGL